MSVSSISLKRTRSSEEQLTCREEFPINLSAIEGAVFKFFNREDLIQKKNPPSLNTILTQLTNNRSDETKALLAILSSSVTAFCELWFDKPKAHPFNYRQFKKMRENLLEKYSHGVWYSSGGCDGLNMRIPFKNVIRRYDYNNKTEQKKFFKVLSRETRILIKNEKFSLSLAKELLTPPPPLKRTRQDSFQKGEVHESSSSLFPPDSINGNGTDFDLDQYLVNYRELTIASSDISPSPLFPSDSINGNSTDLYDPELGWQTFGCIDPNDRDDEDTLHIHS